MNCQVLLGKSICLLSMNVTKLKKLNRQPVIAGSQLDQMPHVHHDHFIDSAPTTDWKVCLEHAEKIGLGTQEYELIEI